VVSPVIQWCRSTGQVGRLRVTYVVYPEIPPVCMFVDRMVCGGWGVLSFLLFYVSVFGAVYRYVCLR